MCRQQSSMCPISCRRRQKKIKKKYKKRKNKRKMDGLVFGGKQPTNNFYFTFYIFLFFGGNEDVLSVVVLQTRIMDWEESENGV